MNITLTITLLAAGTLTVAMLAGLVLVIAGIHREERRMNLSARPRTSAEILTRKILAVHVSQPAARRIFATRHATIAGRATGHNAATRPRIPQPHPVRPAPRKATSGRP